MSSSRSSEERAKPSRPERPEWNQARPAIPSNLVSKDSIHILPCIWSNTRDVQITRPCHEVIGLHPWSISCLQVTAKKRTIHRSIDHSPQTTECPRLEEINEQVCELLTTSQHPVLALVYQWFTHSLDQPWMNGWRGKAITPGLQWPEVLVISPLNLEG